MSIFERRGTGFPIFNQLFLRKPRVEVLTPTVAGITVAQTTGWLKLNNFYRDVLRKCFHSDDMQSWWGFIDCVREEDYTVILAEEGKEILGGIVIEHSWITGNKFMLISWVAVHESHRGRDVGTLLVEAAMRYARDNGASYLFGEVEDPEQYEETDLAYGDPNKRVKFYSRFDCQRVEVPYVIDDNDTPLFGTMFTLFPLTEEQRMATEFFDADFAGFMSELVDSDLEQALILVEKCRETVQLSSYRKLFG